MSTFHELLGPDHDESSFLLKPFSFFTIAASIFFIFLLFRWFFRPTNKNLPPSPPKLPVIGNLHQIGSSPHRSLGALAQRYGPLMLLHFGKVPVLVVSTADAAREILRTHDVAFASRPKTTPGDKFFYGSRDMAMSPHGEYWRQLRSICVLHLLSNKRVQYFHSVREEETALTLEKIEKLSSSSLPINLSEVLCVLTNDIVSRVTFGNKYGEGKDGCDYRLLLRKFTVLVGAFYVGDYIPWLGWVTRFSGLNADLEKAAKELDDFVEGVVQEHENRNKMNEGREIGADSEDQKDFVDILLWVQKENTFGFPIERVSIKAVLLDMYTGGVDATYAILEWAMAELLRHPKTMKQVQNEVRGIAGHKSNIIEEDLNQMHYLKAVIKETLRLHPPAPLLAPRQSTQDVKINGYDIPAGIRVFVNCALIGKDPELWDEAEQFRPERFLDSSIDFKGHDFQLIPFGSGRRGCPGIQFAMTIEELALANLLNKFDWSLPGGTREEDLDMTETTGISIRMKSPLIAFAAPFSH